MPKINLPQIPQTITQMTKAMADQLIHHAKSGNLSPADTAALRAKVAAAPASAFEFPQLKATLDSSLKKVEESLISVPMMAFGWTRELMEGYASVVRGRGTITGPVSPAIKDLNKVGVSPASVVSLSSDTTLPPASQRAQVYAAQKQAVDDIKGMDFLKTPPKGKTVNEHTVLIKPGVNWGINGYPTATSGESTYAMTRQTLEAAQQAGAKVNIVIGDESGIENKAWGGTTMQNFEQCGVLDGGVRAGLEFAAAQEAKGNADFKGAKATLDALGPDRKVTLKDTDAIAMAKKAGVTLVGFEELPAVRVPIPDIKPGVPGNKHFPQGILIPKLVRDDVTDIINLPKPPGRHSLMGCAGLTGAVKNHIGLVGGSDRVPALHGPLDRVPGLQDGKDGPTWSAQFAELGKKLEDPSLSRDDRVALLKQLQGNAQWDVDNENGPNMMMHEKIAELSSVFADKERFTVTDMRKTVSSIGPDIGDTMDIGKVIASKDAATVDVLANSLMKDGYDQLGQPKPSSKSFDLGDFFSSPTDWLKNTLGAADTPLESFYGKTWLENDATAFDTLQVRAAMAYGLAPLGKENIDLKTHLGPGEDADQLFGRVATPE